MSSLRVVAIVSTVAASALLFAACGSGMNPMAAPSAPQAATIQGTVDASPVSASEVRAASTRAGITVSVVGSSIATTTDAAGHFTLTGLPDGSATLRFQGPGIDATLTISGLVAGQTLTITVHVSGSHAHVGPPVEVSPSPEPSPLPKPSPSPHDFCFANGVKAQVEGLISATDASSITVAQQGKMSYQCLVGPSTRIRKGNRTLTLADLQVGNRVHVDGTGMGATTGACQVSANEIKLQ